MLIAGPWVGEFGWELFCWQGIIRKEVKDYDAVCIVSGPGKQAMYSDILNEFGESGLYHEYDCGSNLTDAWKIHGEIPNPFDVRDFLSSSDIQEFLKKNDIIEIGHIDGRRDLQEQEGIYFDYSNFEPIDDCPIVIHARNKETGSNRNWDESNYEFLVDLIVNNTKYTKTDIAFIGSSGSFCVEGCTDKRDISLDETIKLLRGSNTVIGPSSGPIHLASLCKANHITWGSTVPTDLSQRYHKHWNPFGTPCIFIENNSWDISPETIFHHFVSQETLYHTKEPIQESLIDFHPRNNYVKKERV